MTTTTGVPHTPKQPVPDRSAITGAHDGMLFGAAAGIFFVVISIVANFLPGSPPASDASAAQIASYFRDHAGAIKAQNLLAAAGILGLLWWFGALWRLLSDAEDGRPRLATVAAVALSIGIALALLDAVAVLTATLRFGTADATTGTLWTLSYVSIAGAGIGIGTSLLATSVLTARAHIGPRWVTVLGALAAVLFLIASTAIASTNRRLNEVNLLAFLTWCIWIVAISVVMARPSARSAR